MTPRLLVAGVAALTLFAVTACTNDDPADTTAGPSTTRTITIDGSVDPSSSGSTSPTSTASGTATQGNTSGGGGATSVGNPPGGTNPTGGQPTPRTSPTPVGPAPTRSPGYDNDEACDILLLAMIRVGTYDDLLGLLESPSMTPEGAIQIRQTWLNNVNETINSFALTALGLTNDPTLEATINQFISALNGIAAVLPAGTLAEIANAIGSPTMFDALSGIEAQCP